MIQSFRVDQNGSKTNAVPFESDGVPDTILVSFITSIYDSGVPTLSVRWNARHGQERILYLGFDAAREVHKGLGLMLDSVPTPAKKEVGHP